MSETQKHFDVAEDSEEFLSLSLGRGSSSKSLKKKEYGCRFCHRKFPSFQALGGHQNAHKREKLLSKMENDFDNLCPYYVESPFHQGIGNPSWPQFTMMNNDGWVNPTPMNNNVGFGNYYEVNNHMQIPPFGAALNSVLMENSNPYVPNNHQISSSLPDLCLRL
ncbi:unnamed protein product [Lathyrus oleraceus]|uniref:zinc finger protein KNUCKLES-like n=1 Tax=Pisum sativum TaxID=3888 RepID=UPI001FC42C5B|nr:zinc finger protein KNUCKLES-like [Pisum sativum]